MQEIVFEIARFKLVFSMPTFPKLSEIFRSTSMKVSSPRKRKTWCLNSRSMKTQYSENSFLGSNCPSKLQQFNVQNVRPLEKSLQRKDSGQISVQKSISESELDAMVHDFIENGIAERDSHYKDDKNLEENQIKAILVMSPEERSVQGLITSILSSLDATDIESPIHGGRCNGECLRRTLVKHLNGAGYDAALCNVKWDTLEGIPSGAYQFIDILLSNGDRLVIDIDFQTQFSIARPVPEYEAILDLIPLMFVGNGKKLAEVLKFMAKVGKSSLRQSSLHVPPWRTLEYLNAKWFSACTRVSIVAEKEERCNIETDEYCTRHLQQLKARRS